VIGVLCAMSSQADLVLKALLRWLRQPDHQGQLRFETKMEWIALVNL